MTTIRLTVLGMLLVATVAASAAELTIGSPAPAPAIEHWFHDKEPIESFVKDKVYVVEFWATWCGPCISSMPHLREIQERHADDGLTVISVSDEDPETIEQFLDREKDDTTFREITSHYWLATDPDGSMKTDYMRAAGQNGIPTAFIVGKTGEIEWIGHPMRIDEPVAQILAGDWDREAYARRQAAEMELRRTMMGIAMKARENKFAEAKTMLEEAIAATEDPEMRENLERFRGQLERQSKAAAEQAARRGMDFPQQRATVAGLIEMAFALEAGDKKEAAAILDRLLDEVKHPRIRGLLERARERIAAADEPAAAAGQDEPDSDD
jgi:thiol-disulfide isomerase/thioredoxin